MKATFNLSPSSLNLYLSSQLLFYYSYIIKAYPDTKVVECYGIAGQVLHTVLEKYAKKEISEEEFDEYFAKLWKQRKLDSMPGMNGKTLSEEVYRQSAQRGKKLLDTKYKNARPEEKISFSLYEDEEFKIGMKGVIDLPCEVNGELEICDWKTSSNIDVGEGFYLQAKYYSLLTYLKHNKIPKKVTFEYLKIGKEKSHSFTEKELLEFKEYLLKVAKEIVNKGFDIDKYEIGEIDSPFNVHLEKSKKETERRANKNVITAILSQNVLHFESLPKKLIIAMDSKYSYFQPGYQFSEKFKKRIWDGKKHIFKRHQLPYAFVNDFQQMLMEYNAYFKTNYFFRIIDKRNEQITNKTYNTMFKTSNIELREYQIEAVNKALLKKIGILYLGTGAGKTVIACELIKKLNRRSLFLVNRIELVRQTTKVLSNYLGIEIGSMSEGKLDVSKQITVASIQTVYAILKRKDETTKKLELFLSNVTVSIFDEAQNISEPGMYGEISKKLTNNVYNIALTGTPWRSSDDTLEMNALCGFVIYKKTTKELEKEGYLCPTKCIFIRMNNDGETGIDYNDEYQRYIVNNEERNQMIQQLAEKYQKIKKILILTRRVQHAQELGKKIKNSFVITGSTESEDRKDNFETFKESEGVVLIGSSKIFSAGIDIPSLDIIINATGHKSSVESIQIIGRVKRTSKGKKYGYFIDFDDRTMYLKKAAKERREILTRFGNEVLLVDDISKIDVDSSKLSCI